jgi:hypothetical protein
MVNPPAPLAGNAAAPISLESTQMLRALAAQSTVLPLDLKEADVRGHLSDDMNQFADSIKAAFERRQLVLHPGIDQSESFGNYPLQGAAKHIGLAVVWIGQKDPCKMGSIINILHLLKSVRHKDHDGNALVEVKICFTKEAIVGGAAAAAAGGAAQGGAAAAAAGGAAQGGAAAAVAGGAAQGGAAAAVAGGAGMQH